MNGNPTGLGLAKYLPTGRYHEVPPTRTASNTRMSDSDSDPDPDSDPDSTADDGDAGDTADQSDGSGNDNHNGGSAPEIHARLYEMEVTVSGGDGDSLSAVGDRFEETWARVLETYRAEREADDTRPFQ